MAKIKYYGELRMITGRYEEEIPVGNLELLIKEIEKLYGKAACKQAKRSLITIDGSKILSLKGVNTKINSESVVCFFPICGGG